MLSSTHQRIFANSTIALVTIIILLTLYNLRDTRTASNDSLALLSGDKTDTVKVQTPGATNTAMSDTPSDEQDTIKNHVSEASPSTIATNSGVDAAIPSATVAQNGPKRAFVTFLEADTGTNHDDEAVGTNSDNEDSYFVGMLPLPNKLSFPYH